MNSPSNKEEHINLLWDTHSENILKNWGEISEVYSYLHKASHLKFRKYNLAFVVPQIILSTLTGFCSLSLSSFNLNESQKNISQVSINILVGVLGTLLSILKYTQLSEQHLQACQSFEKLHLDIQVELGLPKMNRKPIEPFLRMCKQRFEALVEGSPIVQKDVINKFHSKASINVNNLPSILTNKFEPLNIVEE
jgi:hypothetical protein